MQRRTAGAREQVLAPGVHDCPPETVPDRFDDLARYAALDPDMPQSMLRTPRTASRNSSDSGPSRPAASPEQPSPRTTRESAHDDAVSLSQTGVQSPLTG